MPSDQSLAAALPSSSTRKGAGTAESPADPAGTWRLSEAQEKRLKRADDYLTGLGLSETKDNAEKRAALHAWNTHDAATGIPSIVALVGAIAALAAGELLAGGLVVVLGATLTALIYWHDGGRVMAEAVLKVRDSPRPSLEDEQGSPKPTPGAADAEKAAPAGTPAS